FIRDNRLEAEAHMRSNDAVNVLPHDVFAFTMIQEILSRMLRIEPGIYRHSVGSFHIYEQERDQKKVTQFMSEGCQANIAMPSMPQGDPWPAIKLVLKAEERIRRSMPLEVDLSGLDDYWLDLIKLLQVYALPESANAADFDVSREVVSYSGYRVFVNKLRDRKLNGGVPM
ncbi:MAG: thymidylate synthase, partial [Steroidobacter sp.]